MYLSRKGKGSREILVNKNNLGNYSLPCGIPRNSELGLDNIRKSDGRLDCIVRETFEQSGIKVRNPKFTGAIVVDYSETNNPSDVLLNFYRTGDFVPSELKKGENKTFLWVPESDIKGLSMELYLKEVCSLLRKKKRFSGKVKLNPEGEIIPQRTYFNYW